MLRRATEADLPALAALEADVFGVDAWSVDLLRAALPTLTVSVDEHGTVSGYAALRVGASDVADLDRIAVRPDVRRHGVATTLLDDALEWAQEVGAERVLLEVGEQNAGARAFYARHGFSEIGRRPRYYRGGTDALVLSRVVSPTTAHGPSTGTRP